MTNQKDLLKHTEGQVGSDDHEMSGAIVDKRLMSKVEIEVSENEDASLQDDSYAFDSENTGNDDIHDVSEFEIDSYEDDAEENFQ